MYEETIQKGKKIKIKTEKCKKIKDSLDDSAEIIRKGRKGRKRHEPSSHEMLKPIPA